MGVLEERTIQVFVPLLCVTESCPLAQTIYVDVHIFTFLGLCAYVFLYVYPFIEIETVGTFECCCMFKSFVYLSLAFFNTPVVGLWWQNKAQEKIFDLNLKIITSPFLWGRDLVCPLPTMQNSPSLTLLLIF